MTRFLEFLTLELKKFKKARGYTNLSVFMFKFMFMLFMFMFKLAVAGSFLFRHLSFACFTCVSLKCVSL